MDTPAPASIPAPPPELPVNEAGTTRKSPFGEDKLGEAMQVREMFNRARSARRPLMAQWRRNYRVLWNRAWADQAEPWMPNPKVSQVFPVYLSWVGWMTDQRPTIEVQPATQPFSPFADMYQQVTQDMNTLMARNMAEYEGDGEIVKMLSDTFTYGIGYTKTEWNAWLADGFGDARFTRRDPFTIYPDPHARDEDTLSYIIEAKTMTVTDVDRAFPGAKKLLAGKYMSETVDEAPHRLDDTTNAGQPRARMGSVDALATRWANNTGRNSGSQLFEEPVVTMLECWRRYHTYEPVDNETSKVIEGWWLSIVVDNVVLLSCDSSDVNAYGKHPFDRNVLVDVGEWYGPSMVEYLQSPQTSINRTLAMIEQNVALMGNPVMRESRRAASRNQRLSNRPGQRVTAEKDQVDWLNPPQMNPQVVERLMGVYKAEIANIAGTEMISGKMPSGRNAEGVVDSIQDSAFVRVRLHLRELERCLRGVAIKMAATIAEFYTEPRVVATIGPDGQHTVQALRARHFYTRDSQNPDENEPLRFTVVADAGSQLPTSRQARAAEAERLFALGAIDALELLKAKQWPNHAVVAKRIMEQQAQAGVLGQPPGARQRAGRNT
jgi:hypothetical protein